jgi:hypothetical protein
MAISIPTNLDSDITSFRATLEPINVAATDQDLLPLPPCAQSNRVADLLRQLTGLIDSGTLTATAGSTTSVTDTGAFTTANSLIGCVVTFNGNITAALASTTATVISNTTDVLNFAPGDLAATPQVGDTFTLEFTAIDSDLDALDGGLGLGSTAPGVYDNGPSMINAFMKLLDRIGTVPSYLNTAAAEPYGLGNPHGGGNGITAHGGGALISAAVVACRDAVAAYTAPA